MRKAALLALLLLLAAVPATSAGSPAEVKVSKSEEVVVQLAPDGTVSARLARVTLRLLSVGDTARISLVDYALGIDPSTLSFSSESPQPTYVEAHGPLAVFIWRELTVTEDPITIEYTADYVAPLPVSISHELLVNGEPVRGRVVEAKVSDSIIWKLTIAGRSRKLPGRCGEAATASLEAVDVPTAVVVSLPLDRDHLAYVDISPEPNTTTIVNGVETATWLLYLWGDESVAINVSARVRAFAEWGIVTPPSFTVVVRRGYELVASQLRSMASQLEAQANAASELGETLSGISQALANLSSAVESIGAGGLEAASALRSIAVALNSVSSSLNSSLSDIKAALETVSALPVRDEVEYAIASYLRSAGAKVAGSTSAIANITGTLSSVADSLEKGSFKVSQLEKALLDLSDALHSLASSLEREARSLRGTAEELRLGELAARFASRPLLGPVAIGPAGSPPLPASASLDISEVVEGGRVVQLEVAAAPVKAPEGIELSVSYVVLAVSGSVEGISLKVNEGGSWLELNASEYCGLYWDAERGTLAIPVSAAVSGEANALVDWLGRPLSVVLSGRDLSANITVVSSAAAEGVEVSTSGEASVTLTQPRLTAKFEVPAVPPPPPPAERPIPWLEVLVALSVALAAGVAALAARRKQPKPAASPGPAPSPDELLRKARELEERLVPEGQ